MERVPRAHWGGVLMRSATPRGGRMGVTHLSLGFLRQPLSQRPGKRWPGGNTWEAGGALAAAAGPEASSKFGPTRSCLSRSCARCPASHRGVEGMGGAGVLGLGSIHSVPAAFQ